MPVVGWQKCGQRPAVDGKSDLPRLARTANAIGRRHSFGWGRNVYVQQGRQLPGKAVGATDVAHQLCACRKLISPPSPQRCSSMASRQAKDVKFFSGRVALDSTEWQWAETRMGWGKDCPLNSGGFYYGPGGGRGWERGGGVFRGKMRSPLPRWSGLARPWMQTANSSVGRSAVVVLSTGCPHSPARSAHAAWVVPSQANQQKWPNGE